MSDLAVAGAGAFGTALAISLADAGNNVVLLARNLDTAQTIQHARQNTRYLPDQPFPTSLSISGDPKDLNLCSTILLAIPTQHLRGFLIANADMLADKILVGCCKGIEKSTGLLPSQIVAEIIPDSRLAVLTGPGFAREIASGLPTALTLATDDPDFGATLQTLLTTRNIRLYRSTDMTGAQLGGALKNVIAIACGIVIGAKLGESARAALMTRGYAELARLAQHFGARPETLSGLSGLGDLALTCTSHQSRNFDLGFTLGNRDTSAQSVTVEGVATAQATMELAKKTGIDMPITMVVTAVLESKITIEQARDALLSRPLKQEN